VLASNDGAVGPSCSYDAFGEPLPVGAVRIIFRRMQRSDGQIGFEAGAFAPTRVCALKLVLRRP
jgi:hypothetical protein